MTVMPSGPRTIRIGPSAGSAIMLEAKEIPWGA
jgi:hypothetical protein